MLEQSTTGAEAVTMIRLLGVLGIVPVVNPPVNPLATGADETVSLAQTVGGRPHATWRANSGRQ
jgi:hypothetical protein